MDLRATKSDEGGGVLAPNRDREGTYTSMERRMISPNAQKGISSTRSVYRISRMRAPGFPRDIDFDWSSFEKAGLRLLHSFENTRDRITHAHGAISRIPDCAPGRYRVAYLRGSTRGRQ